ncbi:hypothetical protein [Actinoallomurus soli]|uniref:hypothetical protein n=1 Tax=Actinoallomurus soli TaxID=2952535 RepID=UPI0020931F19|nr:hypothetical protein [Actinoallomurus soli]MCO5970108.1 hypothetical protein [Actinoallomurus soli]
MIDARDSAECAVGMVEEYAQAYASGWGDRVTDTVAGLLGRPPRDITDFVRDHATAFTPAATTRATRPVRSARAGRQWEK